MPTYVTLLRAVNVTGHQTVLMKDLAAVYQSLGFDEVRTYIQSGNVVFRTDDEDAAKIEDRITAAIAKQFGFATPVIARRPHELKSLVAANPFPPEYAARLYVAFLSGVPERPDTDAITNTKSDTEEFSLSGRHVYLHYPDGQGRSKMTNALLERRLGVTSTVRNWRTVNKLLEIAGE